MRSHLRIALAIGTFAAVVSTPATATSKAMQKGLKFVETESGLKYSVTKRTAGELARPGQVIVYAKKGMRSDGSVFDGRWSDPAKPVSLRAGAGRGSELPGIYEALQKLRVGERATLILPPAIGVGPDAYAPWGLSANSTVTYEVEVVAIKDNTLRDLMMDTLAQGGLPAATRVMHELKANNFANVFYSSHDLGISFAYYYRAGDPETAIRIAEWNAELFPESSVLIDLGDLQFGAGHDAEAIAAYSKAVELDPQLSSKKPGKRLAKLKAGDSSLDFDRVNELISSANRFQGRQADLPINLPYLVKRLSDFLQASPDNATNAAQLLAKLIPLYDAEADRQKRQLAKIFGGSSNLDILRAFERQAETSRLTKADSEMRAADLSKPLELKLTTLGGQQVNLADLRGKVVLLGIWMAGGTQSRQSMRHLKKIYDAYHAKGLEILGITVDAPAQGGSGPTRSESEIRAEVQTFLTGEKIPWMTSHEGKSGDGPIAKRFAATGYPTLLLFDKSGIFAENVSLSWDEIEPKIDRLLK